MNTESHIPNIKRTWLFIFLVLFAVPSALAQKEKNIWHFGSKMGLDFSSGNLVVVLNNNSGMDAYGSGSSVSDSSGKLLFYTDGATVFNRFDTPMPNGHSLKNSSSAAQSCIIVKKPGSNTLYYIFTSDCYQYPSGGLHYSVVDMSQNGGLGDVIEKNTVLLKGRFSEKLCVVKNEQECGYWVLFSELKTAKFYVFSFTGNGIDPVPVISNATINIDEIGVGNIKASPNGKKLAASSRKGCELYDFNRETGEVSNGVVLDSEFIYGCSFSPNSSFLYFGTPGLPFRLCQVDVSVTSISDILASKTIIFEATTYTEEYGSFQLGPDEKIYVAQLINHDLILPDDIDRLGVIHNPDAKGMACNYSDSGIMLSPGLPFACFSGLPNFIDALNPFIGNNICYSEPEFPNVFTPNNDSINDVFKSNNNLGQLKFSITIFNRWGESVFKGNDSSAGWDGNFNGQPVPAGVYFVNVKYEEKNHKPYSGTLTLIR